MSKPTSFSFNGSKTFAGREGLKQTIGPTHEKEGHGIQGTYLARRYTEYCNASNGLSIFLSKMSDTSTGMRLWYPLDDN